MHVGELIIEDSGFSQAQQDYQALVLPAGTEVAGGKHGAPFSDVAVFFKDATPKQKHYIHFTVALSSESYVPTVPLPLKVTLVYGPLSREDPGARCGKDVEEEDQKFLAVHTGPNMSGETSRPCIAPGERAVKVYVRLELGSYRRQDCLYYLRFEVDIGRLLPGAIPPMPVNTGMFYVLSKKRNSDKDRLLACSATRMLARRADHFPDASDSDGGGASHKRARWVAQDDGRDGDRASTSSFSHASPLLLGELNCRLASLESHFRATEEQNRHILQMLTDVVACVGARGGIRDSASSEAENLKPGAPLARAHSLVGGGVSEQPDNDASGAQELPAPPPPPRAIAGRICSLVGSLGSPSLDLSTLAAVAQADSAAVSTDSED